MCEGLMEAKREEFDPEHDARTLSRAEEVRKHSGRMGAVRKHVGMLHSAVFGGEEKRGKKGRKRGRGGSR